MYMYCNYMIKTLSNPLKALNALIRNRNVGHGL